MKSASDNADAVPVTVLSADGETARTLDQRARPPIHGRFASLGHFRFDWLDTRHHFSFGEYNDPARMGWGDLRGARVGVWGFGREGKANLRKLRSLGVEPVLVDDNPAAGEAGGRRSPPDCARGCRKEGQLPGHRTRTSSPKLRSD